MKKLNSISTLLDGTPENEYPPSLFTSLRLEDCICPVCLQLLIEPVTLPCSDKHEVCLVCFNRTIYEATMECPSCRFRLSNWARKEKYSGKSFINENKWCLIKRSFPSEVQKRLEGRDDDITYPNTVIHDSAKPGEIGTWYEKEKERYEKVEKQRKIREETASMTFIKNLLEENTSTSDRLPQYATKIPKDPYPFKDLTLEEKEKLSDKIPCVFEKKTLPENENMDDRDGKSKLRLNQYDVSHSSTDNTSNLLSRSLKTSYTESSTVSSTNQLPSSENSTEYDYNDDIISDDDSAKKSSNSSREDNSGSPLIPLEPESQDDDEEIGSFSSSPELINDPGDPYFLTQSSTIAKKSQKLYSNATNDEKVNGNSPENHNEESYGSLNETTELSFFLESSIIENDKPVNSVQSANHPNVTQTDEPTVIIQQSFSQPCDNQKIIDDVVLSGINLNTDFSSSEKETLDDSDNVIPETVDIEERRSFREKLDDVVTFTSVSSSSNTTILLESNHLSSTPKSSAKITISPLNLNSSSTITNSDDNSAKTKSSLNRKSLDFYEENGIDGTQEYIDDLLSASTTNEKAGNVHNTLVLNEPNSSMTVSNVGHGMTNDKNNSEIITNITNESQTGNEYAMNDSFVDMATSGEIVASNVDKNEKTVVKEDETTFHVVTTADSQAATTSLKCAIDNSTIPCSDEDEKPLGSSSLEGVLITDIKSLAETAAIPDENPLHPKAKVTTSSSLVERLKLKKMMGKFEAKSNYKENEKTPNQLVEKQLNDEITGNADEEEENTGISSNDIGDNQLSHLPSNFSSRECNTENVVKPCTLWPKAIVKVYGNNKKQDETMKYYPQKQDDQRTTRKSSLNHYLDVDDGHYSVTNSIVANNFSSNERKTITKSKNDLNDDKHRRNNDEAGKRRRTSARLRKRKVMEHGECLDIETSASSSSSKSISPMVQKGPMSDKESSENDAAKMEQSKKSQTTTMKRPLSRNRQGSKRRQSCVDSMPTEPLSKRKKRMKNIAQENYPCSTSVSPKSTHNMITRKQFWSPVIVSPAVNDVKNEIDLKRDGIGVTKESAINNDTDEEVCEDTSVTTDNDEKLARELQKMFELEVKYNLNALRMKGTENEYSLRTRKSIRRNR